jgi:hypothetical protein
VLYFKDFSLGAMIKNIVTRAKKMAVKRFLSSGQDGLSLSDLYAAVDEEFAESEDFPSPGRLGPCVRQEGRAYRLLANVEGGIFGFWARSSWQMNHRIDEWTSRHEPAASDDQP